MRNLADDDLERLQQALERFQQAKNKQDRAIKLVVLQLLRTSGIIAYDAAKSALDEETEAAIAPPPTENWN